MIATDSFQEGRTPNLVRTTWAALIEETLKPVMLVSLAAYWVWQFWYSAEANTPISSNTVFTTLYSIVLISVIWCLVARRPRLAVIMWGAGLCAGVFVVGLLLVIQPPNILILLAGLLVAIFLGEAAAAATVLAAGILPLFILRELWGFSPSAAMTTLGWSAALIALGGQLHRGLQRMIDWSLTSYQQALDNTAEARRRRGELAKVVKELDMAYYRLSRLNASLVEAWQRASEAESRRAELVTMISHEMRTPLNLILGFSEMIMASPESYNHVPLPSVYRADVTAIYRSSMHLLQLIDDILDLAKADVGKLVIVRQKADLREIVLECMTMLEEYIHTKGLELRCNIEPELPLVNIDRLRIRQVILNLLTNAARFTEAGYIEVAARQQEGEILVMVHDTGRGMSPEKVQTIFQEFEASSTNDENWHSGTGLGVPISKKLVELHGGRMWLESEPQKGTTFYFTLPLDQSGTRVESLEYRDPLPARLEAKPLLLVATADETLVRALQRATEAEVIASDDLQELRKWAVELHPRLVVLDSDDPMDDRQWPVPVLQLRLPDRRRRAKALQAQAVLSKPITREIMLQTLATFAPEAHTILVVDDDSRFSELVERMLGGIEKDGGNGSKYRVLAAYTAMEALEQIRTQKIDAFILDQRLGDSLGSDLCRQIRALPGYESTPVIMVTAYDLDAMVDHPASAATIALPEGLDGVQTLDLVRNVFSSLNPRSSPLPAAEGLLTR